VLIAVSDDGGGINAEAVRNRAIERGLVAADAELTEAETFALLFQPGFSTAKQVTDVSGRGVGMDVVRQRVDSLRGTIEVNSKPGPRHQRNAAPAAHPGHHRRPAGEHWATPALCCRWPTSWNASS
jgi:signal transduction histidine kinase